jgi:hypothetical protein
MMEFRCGDLALPGLAEVLLADDDEDDDCSSAEPLNE